MPHRASKKISSSHSTIIDAAEKLVDTASRLPEVKKISLGLIKIAKGGDQYRLKIQDTQSGLKITVRGKSAVQTIYIYTSEKDSVKRQLEKISP